MFAITVSSQRINQPWSHGDTEISVSLCLCVSVAFFLCALRILCVDYPSQTHLQFRNDEMKQLQRRRSSVADARGLGRPEVNAGAPGHSMLGAAEADGRLAVHQIHEMVNVPGAYVQPIAAGQPMQGRDDVFRAGELVVQDLGEFTRS